MWRRDDGQILPLLLFILLATLGLGVAVFNVSRAAVLRSEAQTAADAAALAGARDIRRQLVEQYLRYGTNDLARVNMGRVRAAMDDYARRNGAELTRSQIQGVDVRAWVRTVEQLGRRAPRGEEKTRAVARARAAISIVYAYGTSPDGSIGVLPSGGGSVGLGVGRVPRVSDEQWAELRRSMGPGMPGCDDVIKLGHLLVRAGFVVGENRYFGGVAPPPTHTAGGYHYKCDNAGALDVNFGRAGDLVPEETAAVDPIIAPLNELGFRTIWRAAGHYNHLHVDIGRSDAIGGGFAPPGGFTGPLEDSGLSVRLIDWDAPLTPFYGAFGLPGGPSAGGFYGGPPDPEVARAICLVLRRYGASPKVVMAAYEAAIVESGVHNLSYGDRDSLGVFQQRPSQGWGTPAQILDPAYAATQFVTRAIRANASWMSAGQLAQAVQRSAFPERYDQRAGQAAALIARYCS